MYYPLQAIDELQPLFYRAPEALRMHAQACVAARGDNNM